jgi:hypothetical protein
MLSQCISYVKALLLCALAAIRQLEARQAVLGRCYWGAKGRLALVAWRPSLCQLV